MFIDAGTTTAYLALAMDDTRRITVVTNSTIAPGHRAALQEKGIEVLVAGVDHASSGSGGGRP